VAGALAVLRGLRERDECGHGGWFDISQLEVYTALSGEDILTASMTGTAAPRMGNRSRSAALQGVYPCCGNDQWITIRLNDRQDVETFMAATGLSKLTAAGFADSHADDSAIAAYTKSQDKYALARRLQQAGLEALPVLDPQDLAADPHLAERGFFIGLHCGNRDCALPGSPFRSNPPLVDTTGVAPRFGEHTAQIMAEIGAAA
jgi:crotonobetainyl-CoA:carnitine CoA-transferase CaiB-like acyl-CoA transferase